MKNVSDKLLVTTSRSLLCVDTRTKQITKLHTGKGLYFGITSDENYIYVGARNRLVSSRKNPEDEKGLILKFDHNLQLLDELQPSFQLKDIHQIRVIDSKLYVTCTGDNMIALYNGREWEQWYPNEFRNQDTNHFNSLHHDEKHIYLMAHNWGESEVYVFDRKNRELLRKIKMGKCAHDIWLDENDTLYTLSSEESRLIDSHNHTTLALEGFPRGIVKTDNHSYIGISERVERNIRDFVDGKILIFDKQHNKTGELTLKSEGMVLDIKVINQKDQVSGEYTRVDQIVVDNIDTMSYDYKGSRRFIRNRLSMYLPLLQQLKKSYADAPVLDIESKRGIWLEMLKENGINSRGTETNKAMLHICEEYGLDITSQDGMELLQEQTDESLLAVSAFNMIENASLGELSKFVSEALRALKPGGILILETPAYYSVKTNPEKFYTDSEQAHSKAKLLLSFLEKEHGSARKIVLKFQEPSIELDRLLSSIEFTIEGVGPDCALLVQKDAPSTLPDIRYFAEFEAGSVSLLDMSKKFESWAEGIQAEINKVDSIARKAQQDHYTLQINGLPAFSSKIKNTENDYNALLPRLEKLERIHAEYHSMLESSSWKVTKPFRLAKQTVKSWRRSLLKH